MERENIFCGEKNGGKYLEKEELAQMGGRKALLALKVAYMVNQNALSLLLLRIIMA